jgi:threonine synthase
MEKIRFVSTSGSPEKVTFKEALFRRQAPDKGLYIPVPIPKLPPETILSMRGMKYPSIAAEVCYPFLWEDISKEELQSITADAYDFNVPLELIGVEKHIMRLDRGPTASFKDFAARMMARLMQYYLAKENKELFILVATSGDTGGAVADAFHNMGNVRVTVLFPKNEVSERQRKQMTTLGDNILAIAIDGKFDDCQAMVKRAFSDPDLQLFNLSSANSINFGRLMPQAVYYFYAYSKISSGRDLNEKITFSVPSGNFGDLMGGIIAREMGLPVSKFIVATNENDEFPRFLETGIYNPIVPSRNCLSNAMNVGHPSNLARLIWIYGGRMDEKGNILEQPDMDRLREDLFSVSIDDKFTKYTIAFNYECNNILVEPHGAVALAALNNFEDKFGPQGLSVSLETAHPAKFPEVVKEVLGIDPEMPECMKKNEGKEEKFLEIENNYSQFKEILKKI